MRKSVSCLLVGGTVAALGAAGTLVAHADWPVPVTATVKVRTAAMPRGTEPSVAEQSKGAVVTWSAQEIAPDVRMTGYVVTARAVAAGARPDIVRTVAASGKESESVTFAASEVAGAQWRWTLTPRFRSWAGTESKPSSALKFDGAVAGKAAPSSTTVDPAAPVAPAAPATGTGSPAAEPPAAGSPAVRPPAAGSPAAEEKSTEKATSPPAQQPEQPPVAVEPPSAEPPPSAADPSASGSAPADVPQ